MLSALGAVTSCFNSISQASVVKYIIKHETIEFLMTIFPSVPFSIEAKRPSVLFLSRCMNYSIDCATNLLLYTSAPKVLNSTTRCKTESLL